MTWALSWLALAVLVWPGPSRKEVGRARWFPSTRRGHLSRIGEEARSRATASVAAAADAVLLLALALRSGSAPVDCLELVAELTSGRVARDLAVVAAALRWGVSDAEAWALVGPDWRPAAAAWTAAAHAGVAPAELLVSASAQIRERVDEATAARVQRGAVLLVLPLGGLFLPGFIATTVLPLVLYLMAHQLG